MSSIYCSTHKCTRTAHGEISKVTRRPQCAQCAYVESQALAQGPYLSDADEHKIGLILAEVLSLTVITTGEATGRYMLGGGYHTKTAVGLYRTLRNIIFNGGT